MDGSGKSTATTAIKARLEAASLPAEIVWGRLGGERELLRKISGPVKRVLRQRGTIADPVAVLGASAKESAPDPSPEGRGGGSVPRRLMTWGWILVVAAVRVRTCRQIAGRRRQGICLVCDRWLADALIDLELRYRGKYRVAERLLRLGIPRPDLAILLEVDAATAARRKPGDQAERLLSKMEGMFAETGRSCGLVPVDARRPQEAVREELERLVDGLVTERAQDRASSASR
jgi:thymidylate kinase